MKHMKKLLLGLGIGAAVFTGAFLALRADRALEDRYVAQRAGNWPEVRPASLESTGAPADFRAAVKKVLPSVVSVDKSERIRRFFSNETELRQTGTGSGVIISKDGYILTNNHVVQGADLVKVRLFDKRSFDAKVVGTDPRSDLAVLKISAPNLIAAEMADSSKLEIGEWVIAVGNPLGFSNTVSIGVISSLNRTLPTQESILVNSIQTDAAINQGNSGGALANATGQVVGINSAIASNSGGSIGLGFSIPINRAKQVVDDILKFGRVRYGWLGVSIYREGTLADPSVREALTQEFGQTPPSKGLLVTRVLNTSPAGKSGIQQYDIITSLDGKELADPVDYYTIMTDKRPGDTVRMNVWSRGTSKTVTVKLEDLTTL